MVVRQDQPDAATRARQWQLLGGRSPQTDNGEHVRVHGESVGLNCVGHTDTLLTRKAD